MEYSIVLRKNAVWTSESCQITPLKILIFKTNNEYFYLELSDTLDHTAKNILWKIGWDIFTSFPERSFLSKDIWKHRKVQTAFFLSMAVLMICWYCHQSHPRNLLGYYTDLWIQNLPKILLKLIWKCKSAVKSASSLEVSSKFTLHREKISR